MLGVKNLLTLLGFHFRQYCSLGYFRCHPLAHIHSRLVVVNITIYYVGLSTLVGLFHFCRLQ